MTSEVIIKSLPTRSDEWVKDEPYRIAGLLVIIEFLAGDIRKKHKGNGSSVSNIMPSAYGFILGTTDQHGEEIDAYIATNPDLDADIYVIDQVNPETGLFDEHKVMLGFSSSDEAAIIYCDVFSDGSGSKRLGAMTTFPQALFHKWLGSEGTSLEPASKYGEPGVLVDTHAGIKTPPPGPKMTPKPRDEAGGVIIPLPDLTQGPKLKISSNGNEGINYHAHLFSALDTKRWSNFTDTICRAMDLSTEKDEFHIHISSRGGSVFLMGRIVSAIHTTKAKVVTYAEGIVASAATTIWVAGHERHILPGSYFMQHMSSQGLGGKSSDIAARAGFCVEYITDLLKPALDMGLFTSDEIADMIDKDADIYISGREASARISAKSNNEGMGS